MGFARDSAITFSAKIVSLALAISISVVVARALGPAGKGEFALAVLVPGLLVIAGQFGLGSAGVYYIGKRRFTLAGLFYNLNYCALLLGSALIVIYHLLARYADVDSRLLSAARPSLIAITTLAIPFILIVRYNVNLFLAEKRVVLFNSMNLVQQAFFLILVLIFLLGLKRGVVALAISWLASEVAAATISFLILRRHAGSGLEKPDLGLLKSAFSFGIKSHLLIVCLFLIYRIDQFVLSKFKGASELGIYSVAVSLGELIWYVPRSLGSILFMRTAHDTDAAANAFTPVVCRHNLFVMVLLAAAAAVIGPVFIPFFYGDAFKGSVMPFLILLPGIVAFGLFHSISSDLTGRGKPHWVAGVALGVLALNVALNLTLTPIWGAVGAAGASTVSYCLGGLLVMALFIRISGTSFAENMILTKEDLAGIVERFRSFLGSALTRRRTR